MAIKLIMTDIDGTVLPYGQKIVPQPVREAFHAAVDAGIHVGPATGRFHTFAPQLFGGDEKCCRTIIAANGMQIVDEGEMLLQKELPADAMRHLVELVSGVPHAGVLFYAGDDMFLTGGTREDLAASFPAYAGRAIEVAELPDAGILKGNAFIDGTLEETRAFANRLNREIDGLSFDIPQTKYLNVMVEGWDKGEGLKWLMNRLGIAPSEVVVFGDGGNDIALFNAVEHSVAVAGAMPEARDAARWHIGAVEDFAVADAVNAIAGGEWPFTE